MDFLTNSDATLSNQASIFIAVSSQMSSKLTRLESLCSMKGVWLKIDIRKCCQFIRYYKTVGICLTVSFWAFKHIIHSMHGLKGLAWFAQLVRLLLSDHKVPSLCPALSRFELICVTSFLIQLTQLSILPSQDPASA